MSPKIPTGAGATCCCQCSDACSTVDPGASAALPFSDDVLMLQKQPKICEACAAVKRIAAEIVHAAVQQCSVMCHRYEVKCLPVRKVHRQPWHTMRGHCSHMCGGGRAWFLANMQAHQPCAGLSAVHHTNTPPTAPVPCGCAGCSSSQQPARQLCQPCVGPSCQQSL